jgi:hypothetical protein
VCVPLRAPPFFQVKSINIPFLSCAGKKLPNSLRASSLFSSILEATADTSPLRRCEPEVSPVGISRMVLVNGPSRSASYTAWFFFRSSGDCSC